MFQHVSKANEASLRWFLFRVLILFMALGLSVLCVLVSTPNLHVTAANVDKAILVNQAETENSQTDSSSRKGRDLFGTLFSLFTNG